MNLTIKMWKSLTFEASDHIPLFSKTREKQTSEKVAWGLKVQGWKYWALRHPPMCDIMSDLWIPIRPSKRANLTRKSRDMSLRQHNRCPNRIHSPDIHGRAHLLVKLVLRKHGPRILTAGWLKNFKPGAMSPILGHHFQEKILKAWENSSHQTSATKQIYN